jgi:hypothetical protein
MIEKIKSTSYAAKSILISIMLIFIAISIFVVIHLSLQNSTHDEHLALAMLFGSLLDYLVIITGSGSAVGITLGVIGLVKDKSKHLFAITGLTINGILLLASIAGFIMSTT